jgi:hypothetical protein
MCAREIEISQMGDHVCGGAGEREYPFVMISEWVLNIHSDSSTGVEWQLLHHAIQAKHHKRSWLLEARTSDAAES